MQSNTSEMDGGGSIRPDAWLYLEEITHRALNDYTAMLAIVRRAAEAAADRNSAEILIDVGLRLHASAMTYISLRPPQDGHVRDLSQELAALCTSISNSILSARGITLTLSADPVTISAFRCWQICLVISELVTNAARHAFRDRDKGSVLIRICAGDGILRCAIVDDGAADGVFAPGRGTTIVNALINDMGGTISSEHLSTGSTIAFCVPLTDAILIPKIGQQGQDCVSDCAIRRSTDQSADN